MRTCYSDYYLSERTMKKEYVTPTVQHCVMEPIMLLALSLEYTDEKADGNIEILSGERRAAWGDIWNE